MRRYELMLLLRPDLEDDKLQSAVEKVTRAIVNAGGSLSKVSPWGKRRLAYPIQHLREASYFLIHFDIEPAEVREIERGMLISEEILRHLVTVLEDRGPSLDEPEPVATRDEDADDGDEGEDVDDGDDDRSEPGSRPQGEDDREEAGSDDAATASSGATPGEAAGDERQAATAASEG